ncbi:hypothetical protein Hanom_Chr13g01207501 [Helianthus anomalus]
MFLGALNCQVNWHIIFLQIIKSKLQVLSFIFVLNFRRCHLPLKLMTFVLNVCKCCTLCPLWQTQL